MDYPTPVEIEQCLNKVAVEIGDDTDTPFRVNLLPVYGDKPPIYIVVMRSRAKEPLRQELGKLLHRSFSLGVGSFNLRTTEATLLVSKYGRKD